MRASYPTYKSTSIPWPDSIPESWELVKISSVFRERRETVSDKDFAPLSVTMQGIVPQLETAAKTDNGDNRKKVCAGDFVINSRSDRKGSAGISHLDGSVSVISIVLKPLKRLNERYVNYLLTNYYFQEEFYRYGKGIVADLWSTKYSSMKGMFIPLPSLEEQTAIANYLDAKTEQINRFIAKKEKLIALLKEQKQAVINELLEDKEGKWEMRKLKYVGRMINGYAFNSEEFLTEGTIKVIKIANIQPMRMDWTEKSFIPESYFEKQKHFSVKRGDLVFALTRPIIKEGIKVAFIDSDEKLLVNQRNAILKPRKNVTKDWLYYCFLTSRFISEFDKQIDKTGQQPNIATEDIGNIKIPFPKLNFQDEVVATIKQETYKIDTVISRIERELEKVQELKQSLIAEVVTGRIKVA